MTTPIQPAAAAAAKAATTVAATVAPAVAEAGTVVARSGMSGPGVLGIGAGAAGIAITLMDAFKSTLGSGRGLDGSALFGSTTLALGAGTGLILLAEKGGVASPQLRNFMRGGGAALVLGGLAGAVVGAYRTFGTPTTQLPTTQNQAPTRFEQLLPAATADLEGVEVAAAEVIGKGRALRRVSVYVDPLTAKPTQPGSSLGDAIGQARAATQADESDRSHAVIQTRDGALWVVRLSGELDQVDGRNYTTGNEHDARYAPQVAKRQQALQAIVGVEHRYVYPAGTSATDAVQDPGTIPWVTPSLPAPSGRPAPPNATPTATPSAAGSSS